MKNFKKRSLSMFIVFCMVFASIPQAIFATDYDNHWAKNSIEKWSKKGLVVGYEDGTFRPSNAITRGELAAILVRVFEFEEIVNSRDYIDVDVEKWYADSVAKISSAKLMNDSGESFRPEAPATREEAAYAIATAYKVTGTTDEAFVDQGNISDWASDSVEALFSNGFISGNPDGTFAPKRTLTRADVVAMLDKITSELINVAGTYTEDVNGNLVVNTRDVILKDMTIKGNLYLTEGIGDGDVTLDNITVEGETFINGGGLNSIKAKNSRFLRDMQVSAKNPVRVVVEGDAVKITAMPGTTITLTGNFSNIILPPGVNVIIKDATVEKIFVQPGLEKDKGVADAVITIEEGSTVKDVQADAPVETKGKGKIENLTVNSEGVKTEQKPAKVEIKDEEIKVEIAKKTETKESIETEKPVEPTKPSTPSTGGGSSGGSSNPSPTKYLIKGKVTDKDGGIVPDAHIDIYYNDGTNYESKWGNTDEYGEYQFYVPANKQFEVQAWVVDEENNGYHASIKDKVANRNHVIDIELEQKYVVNIKITDSNDVPFPEYDLNLREIEKDGNIRGGWSVDSEGVATIFFFDWQLDETRVFNIYAYGIDEPIGKIENVKRSEKLTTIHPIVKLDYGLEDTIHGTVVDINGNPVPYVRVELDRATPNGERDYASVSYTETETDGKYSFTNINRNESYRVVAYNYDGDNVFVSNSMNAVFAKSKPLVIKQSYTVNVKVTDQYGLAIDGAKVTFTDKNGGYGSGVTNNGKERFFYDSLNAGNYTVAVTAYGETILKNITIIEGKYNNFLEFKFNGPEKDELMVEVKNPSIKVGDATLTADFAGLYANGQRIPGAEGYIVDGKISLFIPQSFKGNTATLWIDLDGIRSGFEKEIILTDFSRPIVIDLEKEIIRRDVSLDIAITTDSAIDFKIPAKINFKLKRGYFGNHKDVLGAEINSQSTTNQEGKYVHKMEDLITGPYTLIIGYTIGEVEYETLQGIIVSGDKVRTLDGKGDMETGIDIHKTNHKLKIKANLSNSGE